MSIVKLPIQINWIELMGAHEKSWHVMLLVLMSPLFPSNRDMTRIGISSAAHQDKILSSAQGILSQMQQIQDRMVPVWSENSYRHTPFPFHVLFLFCFFGKKNPVLPHPHVCTLKKKRFEDKKIKQEQGQTADALFSLPCIFFSHLFLSLVSWKYVILL